ncbi:MAG: hypothetical protein ACTSRS_03205 [Candidatus Helarchaeota archaeon]
MSHLKSNEILTITDEQRIAIHAHLELAIKSEKFQGIYLLSEKGDIIKREETPKLTFNFAPFKELLIPIFNLFPQLKELILKEQRGTIVVQPVKDIKIRGKIVNIPGVSYIVVVFPLTRPYRKNLNELIRNLLNPFITKTQKKVNLKNKVENQDTKHLAEQVLKDLDKV